MVVLRDQKYPVEGGSLSFDLIRPNGEGPFPLVVFLHGGGWISGDRTMYRDEAVWLAPQGYACACIEYRLAPLYPFPTPVADAQAFVQFAKANAAELAIDPEQITAVGNSAGGHMALMLGLCPTMLNATDATIDPVNSVAAICPICDMEAPADVHFPIAMTFLEQFLDGPYSGNEETWRRASPMSYARPTDTRFLIVHGSDDDVVPVDQSRRMAATLEEHRCDVEYIEMPGEMHSFTYPGWERIRGELVRFLSQSASVRA